MVESRKEDKSRGKNQAQQQVVSDRRARRKAKRGEDVVRVEATRPADADDEYDDEDEGGRGVTAPKEGRTLTRDEAVAARALEGRTRVQRLPVIGAIALYFQGVFAEIKKVTWPTREEAARLTRIVLGVTIFFSLLLGAFDLGFGFWFREGLENTAVFLAIGAVLLAATGAGWYFLFREQAS